jgi:hypothetical protein
MFKPDQNDDVVKKLMSLKADKIKQATGSPKKNDGENGDVTIRKVENELVIFGKFNNEWYRFVSVLVNQELNDVPEISNVLAKPNTPHYTSGWKDLSDANSFSGTHNFQAIPSMHRVLYATDLSNTKVYILANSTFESDDEKCYFGLDFTTVNWNIVSGAVDSEGANNWGMYYSGGTWAQVTSGYIKLDLWK